MTENTLFFTLHFCKSEISWAKVKVFVRLPSVLEDLEESLSHQLVDLFLGPSCGCDIFHSHSTLLMFPTVHLSALIFPRLSCKDHGTHSSCASFTHICTKSHLPSRKLTVMYLPVHGCYPAYYSAFL